MKYRYIISLLLLQSCAPDVQQIRDNPRFLTQRTQQQFEQAKTTIGQTYWADYIEICDSPSLTGNCDTHYYRKAMPAYNHRKARPAVDPYGPFEVTDIIALDPTGFYYVLKAPSNEVKYVPSFSVDNDTFKSTNPSIVRTEKHAKAEASCERRGGVSVGMTEQQVLASCWGRPNKKNITETAGGIHEQWVYGGGYIYLDQGIVTGLQTERR